jgi:hypothetical protein
MKITYGPRRRYVPVCIRREFGFIRSPATYEENYDRRTAVIVVDVRRNSGLESEETKWN